MGPKPSFLGLIAGKALSAAPQKGRASLGRMGEVVLNTEGPFSDADNLLHLSFRMRLCPSRTTSGVEKPSFLERSLPFWGQDPGQAFLFGWMGPHQTLLFLFRRQLNAYWILWLLKDSSM